MKAISNPTLGVSLTKDFLWDLESLTTRSQEKNGVPGINAIFKGVAEYLGSDEFPVIVAEPSKDAGFLAKAKWEKNQRVDGVYARHIVIAVNCEIDVSILADPIEKFGLTFMRS